MLQLCNKGNLTNYFSSPVQSAHFLIYVAFHYFSIHCLEVLLRVEALIIRITCHGQACESNKTWFTDDLSSPWNFCASRTRCDQGASRRIRFFFKKFHVFFSEYYKLENIVSCFLFRVVQARVLFFLCFDTLCECVCHVPVLLCLIE